MHTCSTLHACTGFRMSINFLKLKVFSKTCPKIFKIILFFSVCVALYFQKTLKTFNMKQVLKHKLTPFINKQSTQNILTIIIFVFKFKKKNT